MESGHILADVLNKQLLDLNYKYFNKTLKLRTKLKLKILKRPFMYNKLLRKLVMKSGLQSIKKHKNNKNLYFGIQIFILVFNKVRIINLIIKK